MKIPDAEYRWSLAEKLESVAALLESQDNAEDAAAVEEAIAVICPDYIAAREKSERDAAAFYENMSWQQIAVYTSEIGTKYPAPSPDFSGTPPAVPQVIPFTKGKKKK